MPRANSSRRRYVLSSKMQRSILSVCLAMMVFLPAAWADTTFEFHSGFWINLHHFLSEQAIADTPPASTSPAWQKAVDYYRREVVTHDSLADEAAQINNRLANLDDAASVHDSGLAPGLIA